MPEAKETTQHIIDSRFLKTFSFGINGAGGGGNVLELHNPSRQEGIIGLTEEIGSECLPLLALDQLKPDATICCVARLGRPGAKADQYGSQVSEALCEGLSALAKKLNKPFPTALFPVEATAGQMARVTRAALAASKKLNRPIGLVDGDVCGGLAVPAVPLANNIHISLNQHPDISLIELRTYPDGKVTPHIELLSLSDPLQLEVFLREKASQAEMGAVWFAWLFTEAKNFSRLFTTGSITHSWNGGQIIEQAISKNQHPADALLEKKFITRIIAAGSVTDVTQEKAPGFAQFSYALNTPAGLLKVAARNEYIVVYDASGRVLSRAPSIICALNDQGPIQSHVLQRGDTISIVEAVPQSLQNNPSSRNDWIKIWESYWKNQTQTWNHPY